MQTFYPFHFRGIPEPTVPLPFSCRSVGHYRTFPGWHNPPKVKSFVELFWGIHGSGTLRIDGRDAVMRADEVAFLFPGDLHHIVALDHWEYRWLTLDGHLATDVVKSFGLDRPPRGVGPCPSQLFERLSHELDDISPQGQRAASATAYEILTLACGHMAGEDAGVAERVRQCTHLIHQRFGDPDLNINALADAVGIHRTSLSRNFHGVMGITPIAYLTSFRVAKALKLLRETTLPIEAVARKTGFVRSNYFTRVIRKHTGMVPRAIRTKGWS